MNGPMCDGGGGSPGMILGALGDPPPNETIKAAADALKSGLVVGIPTDTVYGLAVDPWRPGATDKLFAVKRRPRNVELPVFVSGVAQALELAPSLAVPARLLMEAFWPGPLTIVVPRAPELTADLGDNTATIGLRCPAHPVPLALCASSGPYATTSANLHGEPPIHEASVLARSLKGVGLVLDGGPCDGEPSSVVEVGVGSPRLIRSGVIDWLDILRVASSRS